MKKTPTLEQIQKMEEEIDSLGLLASKTENMAQKMRLYARSRKLQGRQERLKEIRSVHLFGI